MVFIEHQQVSFVNHIKDLLEVLYWGHHLLEVPRTFIYFLFAVASLPYRFHSLTWFLFPCVPHFSRDGGGRFFSYSNCEEEPTNISGTWPGFSVLRCLYWQCVSELTSTYVTRGERARESSLQICALCVFVCTCLCMWPRRIKRPIGRKCLHSHSLSLCLCSSLYAGVCVSVTNRLIVLVQVTSALAWQCQMPLSRTSPPVAL